MGGKPEKIFRGGGGVKTANYGWTTWMSVSYQGLTNKFLCIIFFSALKMIPTYQLILGALSCIGVGILQWQFPPDDLPKMEYGLGK